MIGSKEIRAKFFEFFEKKGHKIVPSAPMVNKDDPTLMFTNAGMNQFKDFFLGHQTPEQLRIADTQKCLRVSGKHNDLEEVGRDSYHHTMFEMLGNWSFGDYFKKEAIAWAWELLVDELGLPADRLYVTVFGGDEKEELQSDREAADIWENWIDKDRILYFGKKDNFWEMGEVGPCGPCSEIHIDLREADQIARQSGADLVNMDNPEVIELWNLVFIQYNRKADGSLEELPEKHVDTGMGFERLSMVLQGKKSNYDSDIFTGLLHFIEQATGINYTSDYSGQRKSDIAMRVCVDHVRAIAFGIADGQMLSNTGAGYVLRRILRRAVRYYYSFLKMDMPLLHRLIPLLAEYFSETFPELTEQKEFIAKVIEEEEKSFLRTLEAGLKRLDGLQTTDGMINGQDAFELYDTYGFPLDLTRLIAGEKGISIDEAGFQKALEEQRNRSRADAAKSVGDWIEVAENGTAKFVGHHQLSVEDAKILKYRTVQLKGKDQYQLVLNATPFYPEGGGQVGDTGVLNVGDEEIRVLDTVKENDLPIHIVDRMPSYFDGPVRAQVNATKRRLTENNHSATHLLHAALRKILGDHVQQRGSLVNADYLRFDFSHFQKMTDRELAQVEQIVNEKIRANISQEERGNVPIEEAKASGAMMLFGEKYGERVRMIIFDTEYSVELCGGCHVPATGNIGLLKIVSESAIAAGVRRIEAVTAGKAMAYLNDNLNELGAIKEVLKRPKEVAGAVQGLIDENRALKKELERLQSAQVLSMKDELKKEAEETSHGKFLGKNLGAVDAKSLKTLAFQLEKELAPAAVLLAAETDGKAQIMLSLSKALTDNSDLHAGNLIRELAAEIQGGGGGQANFASAGGKNPDGIDRAIQKAREILSAR